MLVGLHAQVRLPDTEFLINLGDWPLARRGRGGAAIPMMSWCKTNETDDVLLPTYELTEASAECMGRCEVTIDLPNRMSLCGGCFFFFFPFLGKSWIC